MHLYVPDFPCQVASDTLIVKKVSLLTKLLGSELVSGIAIERNLR